MRVTNGPTRGERTSTSRRHDVLEFLREREDPVEIGDIAQALDIHPNTVRFHLDAMLATGQVERSVAAGGRRGRPPQLFSATGVMDPAGPRQYRLLADILVTHLAASPQPQREALAAGYRWGRDEAAQDVSDKTSTSDVDGLIAMLSDWDFAPQLRPADDGDGPAVDLRHCPFLDLAQGRTDIVCPIHLGLMRGFLETQGSGLAVDRLDAFAEPDRCTAHLTLMNA